VDGIFILATVPEAIGHKCPIFGDIFEIDGNVSVRTERIRIYEDLVFTVLSNPHVQHTLILVCRSPFEEVPAIPLRGYVAGLNFHKSREPLFQCCPARPRIEESPRIVVLCIDPSTRFRTLLVFEPAVRIGDFDPVYQFFNVANYRFGRLEALRLLGSYDGGCYK
jgi:hypothetical protein